MDESGDVDWRPKTTADLRGPRRKPGRDGEANLAEAAAAETPMSSRAEIALDALGNFLLATPLAGLAWFVHDGEMASAVFGVELCLLCSWQVSRFRASRQPFGFRARASRFRRFAAAAVTTGMSTWCINVAISTHGTLEDSIQNAVITGLGAAFGILWLPAWLARVSAKADAKHGAKREAAAGRKVRPDR